MQKMLKTDMSNENIHSEGHMPILHIDPCQSDSLYRTHL